MIDCDNFRLVRKAGAADTPPPPPEIIGAAASRI